MAPDEQEGPLFIYRPAYPVSQFVQSIWTYDGYNPPHASERILSNTYSEINIDYSENPYEVRYQGQKRFTNMSPGMVSGLNSRPFSINTARSSKLLTVVFWPGALYTLFRIPADHFTDRHTPMSDVSVHGFDVLQEKISCGRTAFDKMRIVELFLLGAIRKIEYTNEMIFHALKEIHKGQSIGSIVEHLPISHPAFISRFKTVVGVAPKLYARLFRFTKTIEGLGAAGSTRFVGMDGVDYFDQAHFIKEFTQFSGILPSAYSAQDPRHGFNLPEL